MPNWNFRGVFLHFINFAVRISEAAMKGAGWAGDIIFHNVESQWKGTPSYCDFSRFFFCIIRRKDQRSYDGPGGGQGDILYMINTRLRRVQRSIEGCDKWGEGRGILYFEASVV